MNIKKFNFFEQSITFFGRLYPWKRNFLKSQEKSSVAKTLLF